MSSNSIRERILAAVVDKIKELRSIKVVNRVRLSFSDLSAVASTQLPLVAVVGMLPKPVSKLSSRQQGIPDEFISELSVELYCYALDNVNPDSLVSNLADDLWSVLYSDPTLNGLCLGLNIIPEVRVGYWNPYIAFKLTCVYKYIHNRGGI